MPRNKYQNYWELNNPEKIKRYSENYMKDKTQAKVILEFWVKEAIDNVKKPNQTYGGWIRQFIEQWAKTQESGE